MESVRAAYLGAFAVAAAGCFVSLLRVRRVANPAARRGLGGLLLLTGLWATAHVGRFLPVPPAAQWTFYLAGLVVGLATVGAWLYFCSAYTGHDYHRRLWIRRTALALYLGLVGVKLTNPLHGLYFTTSTTNEPFEHVVISLSALHWVTTGLSYALTAVGFYLLYEMLGGSGSGSGSGSDSDVRQLGGLVALTALPVGLYLLSFGVDGLLTLHYEPIGVAAFAVGALYVADERVVAMPRAWRKQVVTDLDEAVILVDDDRVVREYNRRAAEVFPALADGEGRRLGAVVPRVAETLDDAGAVVAVGRTDTTGPRYLQVHTTPLTLGETVVGRAVVCTDVTRVERQRRQLERQNARLDEFADAIRHELRNTLSVAMGHFDVVVADHPDADADPTRSSVDAVRDAHRQMERIVDDVARLATRHQTVESVEECSLGAVVETASSNVAADGVDVRLEQDAAVVANRPVLVELLSSVVRYAAVEGSERVSVDVDGSDVVITVDGEPVPDGRLEELFAYGTAVPGPETGTVFPTMRAVASSHGWTVDVDAEYRDGVRIRVGDVEFAGAEGPGSTVGRDGA